MGLEAVGDLALNEILSKLGPKETAKVACVNKRFKASATEDSLWSKFCSQDLHLSAPLDPHGNLVPSFKFAYGLWREVFTMYPWPLVKRVKRCWDRLKNWLTANFPEAGATLQQGASETQIRELEVVLKVKLPLPTRVLYRFCNGQVFQDKDAPKGALGNTLGLIGGYTFYHHLVNVYLLPLDEVILETNQVMRQLEISGSFRRKFIVVARSSTFQEKLFFLDCTSGQLYVGTRNLATDLEMLPCVPSGLLNSVHDFNSDQLQDAMLLWLEEHGRCLQDGIIKLREERKVRAICQFPEEPPLCSTAITNGVKVRASAVFVPEAADLPDSTEKYWFAYSIRMSLLPEGCIVNGMHFSSCQLQKRHWIIRANGNVVSDVNAEGVIGKYPLLLPGEREFVYQSCTPLSTSSGSVEGHFTFVPDRLVDSKGAPFEVEVARFPLQLPDYIF
ncbi:F-box protein SKIP16 [Manihot esculenta]|uniref:ApaG domain-containing protein n=1 Tax=Manihot esculenta TaxID=3983 RepID=A0A2C9V1Z5_MANES|nr:F-box protein SKIP16 [Manihot esculenta]